MLGARESGGISITGFEPIACEHETGPSFSLSETDKAALAMRLRHYESRSAAGGQCVVGWYHSHTRTPLSLSREDLAFHNEFFREPWHVALLLRHYNDNATDAGLFFEQPASDELGRIPETGLAFEPFVVGLDVLSRIQTEAGTEVDLTRESPVEVGGLLTGSYDGERLHITGIDPIVSDDAASPSSTFPEGCEDAVIERILKYDSVSGPDQPRVLGWYHWHSRPDLTLSEEDRAFHDKIFTSPWQVALLLHHDADGKPRAGFYFREGDVRSLRAPSRVVESELKEAAYQAARELVRKDRGSQPRAFAVESRQPVPIESGVAPTVPPVRQEIPRTSRPPDEPPADPALVASQKTLSSEWLNRLETEYRDTRPRRKTVSRWHVWAVLAAMFAFAVSAVFYLRFHYAAETSRTLLSGVVRIQAMRKGNNIEVSWDPRALGNADQAQMDIGDGSISARMILDQNVLSTGRVTYASTSDVTRFRLHIQRADGSTLDGSTTYVAPNAPAQQVASDFLPADPPPALENRGGADAQRDRAKEQQNNPQQDLTALKRDEDAQKAAARPEPRKTFVAPPAQTGRATDRLKVMEPQVTPPPQANTPQMVAQAQLPILQHTTAAAPPPPPVQQPVQQASVTPVPKPAAVVSTPAAAVPAKPQMQIAGHWRLQPGSISRSPAVPESVAIDVVSVDSNGACQGNLEARYKSGSKKEKLTLSFSGRIVNGVARFPWRSADGKSGEIEFIRVPSSPNSVEVVWYGAGAKQVFDEVVKKAN